MDSATLEQIKHDWRIADVVAATGLTVIGRGHVLTTKEHDSLKLFVKTDSFYWFARGCGGDVINWIECTQNLPFNEACAYLNSATRTFSKPQFTQPAPISAPSPLNNSLAVRMHAALTAKDRTWWHARGIQDATIDHFLLGVYHHNVYGLCYSIPIFNDGQLVNIRLRLAEPPKPKDKYRPYDAGRGTQLYHAEVLTPTTRGVVIVAGELKAVVLWQYGVPAISPTAGCGHWRDEWSAALQHCQVVYVAFDPGEEAAAERIVETIGARARLVLLPDKPDDFVLQYGADALRFHLRFAGTARTAAHVRISERIATAFYAGPAAITPAATNLRVPWRNQLWQAGRV